MSKTKTVHMSKWFTWITAKVKMSKITIRQMSKGRNVKYESGDLPHPHPHPHSHSYTLAFHPHFCFDIFIFRPNSGLPSKGRSVENESIWEEKPPSPSSSLLYPCLPHHPHSCTRAYPFTITLVPLPTPSFLFLHFYFRHFYLSTFLPFAQSRINRFFEHFSFRHFFFRPKFELPFIQYFPSPIFTSNQNSDCPTRIRCRLESWLVIHIPLLKWSSTFLSLSFPIWVFLALSKKTWN